MEDPDMDKPNVDFECSNEEHSEEEDMKVEEGTDIEGETEVPLEIGGFLTPVKTQPPIEPAIIETLGRDLSVGQVIYSHGRHCDIISRNDTRAQSGPLASRHQVTLKLVELFDVEQKERLEPIVVKATQKLQRVNVARVRYSMVRFALPP